MKFTDQLEARFAEMLPHYPVKRSLLVPFLLYTQDEYGYVKDEVIEELARRLDITELDIRGVISYYCLLRDGEQMLEHVRDSLGVHVNQGTTADGVFSVEEVECIGACSWAPAMQVNYDFHDNLTPEKIDRILKEYREKAAQ